MSRRSSKRNKEGGKSSSVDDTYRGQFFVDNFKPGESTPQSGPPSLYHMPWLGRNQTELEWGPPHDKTGDRREYIKMTSTNSDESNGDKETKRSKSKTPHCVCSCCKGKGREKRSKSGTKRVSSRVEESMALEAESLGRRLAMAVSMFAAGFALGNVTSKWNGETKGKSDE